MGPTDRPETSVNKYQATPHNVPEEGRSWNNRDVNFDILMILLEHGKM